MKSLNTNDQLWSEIDKEKSEATKLKKCCYRSCKNSCVTSW